MSKLVEIYDPPLCCPTGICGPAVDPKLVAVQEAILKLQQSGVLVRRYQMTSQPAAFMQQPEVAALLRTAEGIKALPVTVVNGAVIKRGEYPALAEIEAVL